MSLHPVRGLELVVLTAMEALESDFGRPVAEEELYWSLGTGVTMETVRQVLWQLSIQNLIVNINDCWHVPYHD